MKCNFGPYPHLIHLAAKYDEWQICEVLVKAKVDVNLRDKKTGQTALDIAIEHEREDTGYILLKLGAKVNKRKYPSDWIKPEKK